MKKIIKEIFGTKLAKIISILFIGLTLWWVYLNIYLTLASDNQLQLWAATYQIIAIYGAVIGLFVSKHWGGFRSVLGKAILAFSLGLLFQSFGQSTYSYYIYFLHIDVPYPSVGDIGFFGSIFFYIYGALMLVKASGGQISLRSIKNKIQVVIVPLILLSLTYVMFLKEYEIDLSSVSNLITTLLDFGYPIGQAIYVSIAVLAFSLSRHLLGGIMRFPILLFIFALIFQYLSDFMFLYQANKGVWSAGGINDPLYAVSYFLMALSIIYIGNIFIKIKEGKLN